MGWGGWGRGCAWLGVGGGGDGAQCAGVGVWGGGRVGPWAVGVLLGVVLASLGRLIVCALWLVSRFAARCRIWGLRRWCGLGDLVRIREGRFCG